MLDFTRRGLFGLLLGILATPVKSLWPFRKVHNFGTDTMKIGLIDGAEYTLSWYRKDETEWTRHHRTFIHDENEPLLFPDGELVSLQAEFGGAAAAWRGEDER